MTEDAEEPTIKAKLFGLKDVLVIGGVTVSLTTAFINVKNETSNLENRVQKLEKLELSQLSSRVDRLACKIGQLRRQLANQPLSECPD